MKSQKSMDQAVELIRLSRGGEQHGPIQHRDGRPPWCPYCRRTNTGQPIK